MSQTHILAASNVIWVINATTGEKLKSFKLHTGPVTSLMVIPKPPGLSNLAQTSITPLKRTKENEPSVVQFSISHRPRSEEPPTAAEPQEVRETRIREEISESESRLRELNASIYKMWVEHWI